MKPFYPWLLLLVTLMNLNAYASRFNRQNQNSSQKSSDKPVDWPGHYTCEQCTGTPTASPAPGTASKSGCWKYDVTIIRYDTVERGQVAVSGPGSNGGFKSMVAPAVVAPDMVEFHYTEPIESSGVLPYKKDDVLVALQRLDGDYILRFRKLPSKVSGQTAITCKRA